MVLAGEVVASRRSCQILGFSFRERFKLRLLDVIWRLGGLSWFKYAENSQVSLRDTEI